MIIDDDYCQYDTFRIINKADSDAIAAFGRESENCTVESGKRELEKWKNKALEMKSVTQETEESVYQLTYAERMIQRWKKKLEQM